MKCNVWILVTASVFGAFCFTAVNGDVNGGKSCLGCSALVAIVEQMSEMNNASVSKTLSRLCDLLPLPIKSSCTVAFDYLGPFLIKLIVNKNGPDVVCHALGFCYTEEGQPVCKSLNPQLYSKLPFEVQVAKAKALIRSMDEKNILSKNLCDLPGIKQICKWIERPYSQRVPLIDLDGDGFSTRPGLRGTYWRGKDCSDITSLVHPGAKPLDNDKFFDANCNGIYGINNVTHQPYEEELCASTEQRGIAVLGDSISAHFSLPPVWLDVTKMTLDAFKHVETVIENELDWPMLSTVTGHLNNSWPEVITGPVDSVYLRMFERNRCIHRDYQNIAVNGAQSESIHKYMTTLSRIPGRDYPLFLALALVGNDICRGKRITLEGMTTPEEIYNNTLTTLTYLDGHLPANSYVMVFGVADGRILYDNMHSRIHPLGTYWNEFTYSQFYDFMNCVDVTPCPGWMNSNETIREMAYKRVTELNAVLKELVSVHKGSFQNFTLLYSDTPIKEAIEDWEKQGGEAWQLIEPSDGFHTNQYGQAMTTKAVWKILERDFPEALGPVNPNNDLIKKIFGDQGGY